MSQDFYDLIEDLDNPKRKEYKHEFYCYYCAEIGFFKKQTTWRLWSACPNCHDGSMNYIDSNSKLWGNDEVIKEYLYFINKLTKAQDKHKKNNFCFDCYRILLNEKYKELTGNDINSFERVCYSNCKTPSKDDIELLSLHIIGV